MRIAVIASLAAALGASCASAGPPAHRIVYGSFDPHSLDLASLIPRGSAIDGVWFVPAGRKRPQIAIVWRRRSGPVDSYGGGLRFSLTIWNPEGKPRWGSVRWVEHRLVRASPFSIGVRLADVTHDGHADLLVDIAPPGGGNNGAEWVSVFATFGRHVRRILGACGDTKYGRVCGRGVDGDWGTHGGLLWFDEPRGGSAACCPDYYVRYTLRWSRRGWRTRITRLR